MTDPISIIVPVGRVDDDLDVQLRALSHQRSTSDYEVVLVCNSSDPLVRAALDRSVAILGDHRFRIIEAGERRGASFARNTGVREATGEILAFCDGDDVVHETWLENITNSLADFDVVGGRLLDFGLNAKEAAVRPPATPDELPTFMGVPYVVSASMATTRSVFLATGGFDESLIRCEDIAISWKALSSGYTLGFAPNAHTDYRHRPGVMAMVRQHVMYGRGMSQVLMRYGIPDGHTWAAPRGLALLRPNGQPGGRRSMTGVLRRGSLAAGRTVGIVTEWLSKARSPKRRP